MIIERLQNGALTIVDFIFRHIPQKIPSIHKLEHVKLVSHRGEHDNKIVFENTFDAFDPIQKAEIWGIEFDVRWTRDLVPVVIHDQSGHRVFKNDFVIQDNDWQDCQKELPLVPSLYSVVERYGGKCHLMIELKDEQYPEPSRQKSILQEILAPLIPQKDFHIISLNTKLFEYVDFLPKHCFAPVATTNAKELSEYVIDKAFAGLTGHYLFITNNIIKKHQYKSQKIGSGFANSKGVLFREINKDIDWIFTNNALEMQAHLNTLSSSNKK